jgi:hypothetical protein
LAQWNIRNDVIHEVQRKLVHFAACARATYSAPFAGKPDKALVPAARANNADEAAHWGKNCG